MLTIRTDISQVEFITDVYIAFDLIVFKPVLQNRGATEAKTFPVHPHNGCFRHIRIVSVEVQTINIRVKKPKEQV